MNGYREFIEECNKNVIEGIEIAKELEGRDKFTYTDYEVIFNFDVQSLLENYKCNLNNTSFEKLTVKSNKMMLMYPKGLRKPRKEQRRRIENGLHQLGHELHAKEL